MKPSELLLVRLRNEGVNIPPGAKIIRTYAGWRQRQQGAWSWYVVDADGREVVPHIGSPETIGVLLSASSLQWGGPLWGGAGYIDVGAG